MLSLGLESLTPVEVSSEAMLLQESIECMRADIELERAIYDAQTFITNMHNYNEIVSSLQKHSSSECLAFAQELLGPSFEAEQAAKAAEEQKKKKHTFGHKVLVTLKIWWRKFRQFLRHLRATIAGWFKSEKGTAENKDITVTVPMSGQELDKQMQIVKGAGEGKNITVGTPSNATVTLKIDEAEDLMEKQLAALATCEKVMEAADPEKATKPEDIKKSISVKKAVAPVVDKISKGFNAVKGAVAKAKAKKAGKAVAKKKDTQNEVNVLHETTAYFHRLPD